MKQKILGVQFIVTACGVAMFFFRPMDVGWLNYILGLILILIGFLLLLVYFFSPGKIQFNDDKK